MDILGIGPLEMIGILVIMLIVMGPTDMVKAGRVIGRYLRRLMLSPTWKTIQDTSRQLRHLPNTLVRQAGLEEMEKELQRDLDLDTLSRPRPRPGETGALDAWTRPPGEATSETRPPPADDQEDAQPPGSDTS